MATERMTGITSNIAVTENAADEVINGVTANISVSQKERQDAITFPRGTVDAPKQLSMEKIDAVVSELRGLVQTMRRDLNFHVDYVTGRVVIRVVETATNKVVRQIPENEILSLTRRLEDILDDIPKGVLIKGGN